MMPHDVELVLVCEECREHSEAGARGWRALLGTEDDDVTGSELSALLRPLSCNLSGSNAGHALRPDRVEKARLVASARRCARCRFCIGRGERD